MTCKQLVEFLIDYLSSELPPEQVLEFERHLAICPPCVAYLKTYEATIRLGREALRPTNQAVPPEAVPEELVRAVLAVQRRSASA
jgi:anti-sigma factor RsiW